MVGELERAFSGKIGNIGNEDELLKAMVNLLILLLKKLDQDEERDFSNELQERIKNKYPQYNNRINQLIPSPS